MKTLLAVLLLCAPYVPAGAQAQYPDRPIKLVVPFTPGTGIDILARVFGQKLQERMKTPVVIENRPGASGNIGTEAVAKAPAELAKLIEADLERWGRVVREARISAD